MSFAGFPILPLDGNDDREAVTFDDEMLCLPEALAVAGVWEWMRPVGEAEPDGYEGGPSDEDTEHVIAGWAEEAIEGDTSRAGMTGAELIEAAEEVALELWREARRSIREDREHYRAHGPGSR